jgi:hypothetical protein
MIRMGISPMKNFRTYDFDCLFLNSPLGIHVRNVQSCVKSLKEKGADWVC